MLNNATWVKKDRIKINKENDQCSSDVKKWASYL